MVLMETVFITISGGIIGMFAALMGSSLIESFVKECFLTPLFGIAHLIQSGTGCVLPGLSVILGWFAGYIRRFYHRA